MGTTLNFGKQQWIRKRYWPLNFFSLAFCSALAAPPQCRGTTTMSWTWPNGRCHSSNCAGITLSTCLALSVETLEVKAWRLSLTNPSTHLHLSTRDEGKELELSGAPPSQDLSSDRD